MIFAHSGFRKRPQSGKLGAVFEGGCNNRRGCAACYILCCFQGPRDWDVATNRLFPQQFSDRRLLRIRIFTNARLERQSRDRSRTVVNPLVRNICTYWAAGWIGSEVEICAVGKAGGPPRYADLRNFPDFAVGRPAKGCFGATRHPAGLRGGCFLTTLQRRPRFVWMARRASRSIGSDSPHQSATCPHRHSCCSSTTIAIWLTRWPNGWGIKATRSR